MARVQAALELTADDRTDLSVRRASLDRLDRLLPLMRAAFRLPVADGHFAWKYLANPSGPMVGFEAVGPDGPVAFFGVIPETYLVRGERTRVYQPVDIMIHPAYRSSGLYSTLSKHTYDYVLAEEGRCTLVAFPNAKLLSAATKHRGWTLLHTIPFVFLPRVVHRARRLAGGARDLTFTTVRRAVDLDPYLRVRPQPERAISIEISAEFLQWRGFDHPYGPAQACLAWRGSEPVGMCLFSAEPGSRCMIRLADFISPETYGRALVALADYLFEETRAAVLYTWRPVDAHRRAALRRSGFVTNPTRWGAGSTRYSFITRSWPRHVNGEDWLSASSFDVQPIMHD